jgi:hypothetical protein
VGRRTGPLTRSSLSFARLIKSAETVEFMSVVKYCDYVYVRTLFKVLDVAAGQSDANFVNFCSDGCTSCIVILFSLSDVATHFR